MGRHRNAEAGEHPGRIPFHPGVDDSTSSESASLVIRADPAGTGVATVVHVTAPDIATPLVFNIPKGELASECYCPANPAAQEAELCTPQFGAAYTIFVNLTAASASTGQASDGGTIAGGLSAPSSPQRTVTRSCISARDDG